MQTEGVRTKDRILICSEEAKSAIRSQPGVLIATYQPAVQRSKKKGPTAMTCREQLEYF